MISSWVSISTPAVIGTCDDCGCELKGDYLTNMLPDCVAKNNCKDLPITFVKQVRYNLVELLATSVVCFDCAMKLPEINGFWGWEGKEMPEWGKRVEE